MNNELQIIRKPLGIAFATVIIACAFVAYFALTIKYVATTTNTFSSSDNNVVTTETHKTFVNKDGIRIEL